MKVCTVCGEVYADAARECRAHAEPLCAWTNAIDAPGLQTDEEAPVRPTTTPFHLRAASGALGDTPWESARDSDTAVADTPVGHVSGTLRRVRAPTRGCVMVGRYVLSRQLGVGGYGAVFAAEDQIVHQQVAVKVLSPAASQSAEMLTRFHREAIAATRARHPNIVEVLDFDVDDGGSHFIVMEQLDGQDLAQALAQAGDQALPVSRALTIAMQCARGLAAAHRSGILHRDLKPANVFLVRTAVGDCVKIIDFGISKLTRVAGDYTDVTSASKVVGTPCYMSPEQATGADLDARTDVYSLGIMLFEMLVGARPFFGRSPIDIMQQHVRAPRVPPSQLRPQLATCEGLDALVLRMIAPTRTERFASMHDVIDAITDCLATISLSTSAYLPDPSLDAPTNLRHPLI